MARRGIVYLVGAGPGDPDLITVRGLACLRRAQLVVHDRLIPWRLLREAPASAERIDVGKAPGHKPWPQERINALLVAAARRGRIIVRLKGGDPFVFGRGGEECEALARAGARFEVVPGVSSAIAAPAYAGIPLTHRSHARSFTVVTGHTCDAEALALDWPTLARAETLVILMGLKQIAEIAKRLVKHGRAADTPVAVVQSCTTKGQRVVRGTLGDIAQRCNSIHSPATIVVGEVVALADLLHWFHPSRPSAQSRGEHAVRPGAWSVRA